MSRHTKSPFDVVTTHLGQLSHNELQELDTMLQTLLAIQADPEEDEPEAIGSNGATKPGAKGYVEEKIINGCGPYLYLRYWEGKRLRSKYIGKPQKEE